MKPIETKYDKIRTGEPANNEKVFAIEINSIASELENAVASGGQTLDEANNYQLARSITDHALGARHSVDTGTVNNYILSQTGSRYAPTTLVAGYVLEFFTGNANTTTTPTLNYATLGVKTIVAQDGTTSIAVGDIKVGVLNTVKYDGTNWRLILPVVNLASQTVSGISYLNKQIIIANNATDADNDVDFTSGTFTFSDYNGMASVGAMTKRLDASWTAGTNQGGLGTGAKEVSTWYNCYAIYNPTTQVSDCIFFKSSTSIILPSGFTKYKYLGSIYTNASGNILPFEQDKDYFFWKTPISNVGLTFVSGIYTTPNLSCPPHKCLINTNVIVAGGNASTATEFKVAGSSISFGASPDFYLYTGVFANSTSMKDWWITSDSKLRISVSASNNVAGEVITYGYKDLLV